jgi:hypothetical protein
MNIYYIQANHRILIYLPPHTLTNGAKGAIMASPLRSLTKFIIGANITTLNSLRNVIYGLASQWRLLTKVRADIMPTAQNDEESSQCVSCGKWKTAPSRDPERVCKNWFREECRHSKLGL